MDTSQGADDAHVKSADYTDSLTVFVSTVGFPTFEKCIEQLRAQDCEFQLKIIDHVGPMSAAFQRMMDTCTTPYFVQVDEDMLLYPRAIRTLFQAIVDAGERVAQCVYALYDEHLERVIYGIKIYRHDIVRRYPFRDVDGCEWDQIRRFRADGFIDIRVPIEGAERDSPVTLGRHGTYWEPRSVFIRFAMLERRRRKGNRTHDRLVNESVELLRRFLSQRSDIDFYALMGVLAGSLTDRLTVDHERDYRHYEQMPGLEPLMKFVDEVRQAWSDGDEIDPADAEIDVLRDGPESRRPV